MAPPEGHNTLSEPPTDTLFHLIFSTSGSGNEEIKDITDYVTCHFYMLVSTTTKDNSQKKTTPEKCIHKHIL